MRNLQEQLLTMQAGFVRKMDIRMDKIRNLANKIYCSSDRLKAIRTCSLDVESEEKESHLRKQ